MTREHKDVFICHASEDKEAVVRPLAKALRAASITYWLDEAEINWGDSIAGKIGDGLRVARYVIVVLSPRFLARKWTAKELQAAISMEVTAGEIKVLPLVVGTEDEIRRMLEQLPLIADKLHLRWNGDPGIVVAKLQPRLKGGRSRGDDPPPTTEEEFARPRIRERFTQLDRDQFRDEAFQAIRALFQRASESVSQKEPDIRITFKDITAVKFVCTAYLRGKRVAGCRVLLGGPLGDDSISVRYGDRDLDDDNSMNDWLSVVDHDGRLALKPSGMGSFTGMPPPKGQLSPNEAGHYLWRSFMAGMQ